MLWIPDAAGLRAGLGCLGAWRGGGGLPSLLFCLLLLPLAPWCPPPPPVPGWGGGETGWDVIRHAAIGVFSQSEAMAAACTLLTAAVKTLSRPAAR